jgi:hypothetical protein
MVSTIYTKMPKNTLQATTAMAPKPCIAVPRVKLASDPAVFDGFAAAPELEALVEVAEAFPRLVKVSSPT